MAKVEYWFKNGNKRIEVPCDHPNIYAEDAIWDGWYKRYYITGQLDVSVFFKNSLETGIKQIWESSGIRIIIQQNKLDERHGVEINWNYDN